MTNQRLTLGTATTSLKKPLVDVVLSLSDQAEDLLHTVVYALLPENDFSRATDPRGVYVEHDKQECKPHSTKAVKELLKSGLVTSHEDSGDGVEFLMVNLDVAQAVQETGYLTEFTLVEEEVA